MKLFRHTEPSELTAVEAAVSARDKSATLRERLVLQAAQAETELARLQERAASAALREAPLDVEEAASAVATAQATHQALDSALSAASSELASAEQALAVERDREQRAASIHELEELVNQIKAASGPFAEALASLLAPLRRGADVSLDVKQSFGFVELLQSDMPQMIANATHSLDLLARNIEGRSSPARLPRPAPTPLATTTTAPAPTRSVMPLHDIAWTDSAGQQRHGAKHWDTGLPIATAEHAIRCGIAFATEDQRCNKLRAERGGLVPDLTKLVNLDDPNPTPPPPEPERWLRPFADPVWQMPTPTGAPRPWIGKPTT